MATDYDSPRKTDDELNEAADSLEELKARKTDANAVTLEIDESESPTLPGADLSDEELRVKVVPKQADEFTCSSCFLVHHRSQLSELLQDPPVCRDCATRMNRKAKSTKATQAPIRS